MQEKFTLNPLVSHAWFVDVDEPFSSIRVLGGEERRHTRFYHGGRGPLRLLRRSSRLYCAEKALTVSAASSKPRRLSDSIYADAELAVVGVLTPASAVR